mmetsp:Transcript_25517/g.78638  ORF Transcript_25517/g.78638 Transcript_25517/m.78638 type:complete len:101 (+) Transcript_25517:339-641(+)
MPGQCQNKCNAQNHSALALSVFACGVILSLSSAGDLHSSAVNEFNAPLQYWRYCIPRYCSVGIPLQLDDNLAQLDLLWRTITRCRNPAKFRVFLSYANQN